MAIEKFFEEKRKSDVIFNPSPAYSGVWLFGVNNLIKNSNKENGRNMFGDYYENFLNRPLRILFRNTSFSQNQIRFISRANDNNIGRKLSFNKGDFILTIVSYLNFEIDKQGKSKEEHKEYIDELKRHINDPNNGIYKVIAEALNEKIKRLRDVKRNGFQSDYFDAAMKDYEPYSERFQFEEYLQRMITYVSDCVRGLLELGDFFDINLDGEEIYKCFDPDKFYLLFATIIYEQNYLLSSKEIPFNNNYGYLFRYFEAADKMALEDKNYNPYIDYEWADGKKGRVTRRELQNLFEELKRKHPEDVPILLPDIPDEDAYRNIPLIEKLVALACGSGTLGWEFLPKGERIARGNTSKISERTPSLDDEDKLLDGTNMRIEILENSGFIGTPLKGIDTFNGYYAFVYANGVVVLERFWRDESALKPAKECATYVMDIDNFNELSRMPKTDIINMIKQNPQIQVKRIFHTSINNWHRNVYDAINGKSYRLEEAISFVDSLRGEMLSDQ